MAADRAPIPPLKRALRRRCPCFATLTVRRSCLWIVCGPPSASTDRVAQGNIHERSEDGLGIPLSDLNSLTCWKRLRLSQVPHVIAPAKRKALPKRKSEAAVFVGACSPFGPFRSSFYLTQGQGSYRALSPLAATCPARRVLGFSPLSAELPTRYPPGRFAMQLFRRSRRASSAGCHFFGSGLAAPNPVECGQRSDAHPRANARTRQGAAPDRSIARSRRRFLLLWCTLALSFGAPAGRHRVSPAQWRRILLSRRYLHLTECPAFCGDLAAWALSPLE